MSHDYWYVMHREDDEDPWNIVAGMEKEPAQEMFQHYLSSGESAVLGFGALF